MEITLVFYIIFVSYILYLVFPRLFSFFVLSYLTSYTGATVSIFKDTNDDIASQIFYNFYLKNKTYLLMMDRVVEKMYTRGAINKEEFQYYEDHMKINTDNDSSETREVVPDIKVGDIHTQWPTKGIWRFFNKDDAMLYIKHRFAWFLMYQS